MILLPHLGTTCSPTASEKAVPSSRQWVYDINRHSVGAGIGGRLATNAATAGAAISNTETGFYILWNEYPL